jgi:hypothetical protein
VGGTRVLEGHHDGGARLILLVEVKATSPSLSVQGNVINTGTHRKPSTVTHTIVSSPSFRLYGNRAHSRRRDLKVLCHDLGIFFTDLRAWWN